MNQNLIQSWIATIRHMTEIRLAEQYEANDKANQLIKPSQSKPKVKHTPKMPFQEGFVNNKAEMLKAINLQNSDIIETAKSMLSKGRINQNLFDQICKQLMLCI